MKSQKKEILFRRKSLIGQSNKHLCIEEKFVILIEMFHNKFLSRAFDKIFNTISGDNGLVNFQDKKVDKNLLEHLVKHTPSNLEEIRSRSQISCIRKDKSRSRTPLGKKVLKGSIYEQSPHEKNVTNLYKSQNIQGVSDLYDDNIVQMGHKKSFHEYPQRIIKIS